jgi:hypothetical protein
MTAPRKTEGLARAVEHVDEGLRRLAYAQAELTIVDIDDGTYELGHAIQYAHRAMADLVNLTAGAAAPTVDEIGDALDGDPA